MTYIESKKKIQLSHLRYSSDLLHAEERRIAARWKSVAARHVRQRRNGPRLEAETHVSSHTQW